MPNHKSQVLTIQSTKIFVDYVKFCFFFLVSLGIAQGKIFLGYLL